MLYYLFRFLEQWGITGSHMWGYISFRALLALILSLVISAWFGEKFIKYLKSKQITETQRDPGHPRTGIAARQIAQHLSDPDDHHHRMAWFPRWYG